MRGLQRSVAIVATFALVVALGACASGSQASKGAQQGATSGAVGGIVAGAVGGLLFGGNPLRGAVVGGVTGAAAGAAVGGMAGAQADKQAEQAAAAEEAKKKREAELAELKGRMGEQNYEAAALLARCEHSKAIKAAKKAYASAPNSAHRTYALFIEAAAAEESGQKELATPLYPQIVKEDPSRGTAEKARMDTLDAIMKLQKLRQESGLPAMCTST